MAGTASAVSAWSRAEEKLPSRVALPEAVRAAGGTLWWSGEGGCVEGALDVASARVRRLPEEECHLWPSPDGALTVRMVGRFADLFVDRRLVVFPGEHVPAPSVFRLPFTRLPGAWRGDAGAFAFCFTTPQGPVVRVVRPGAWRTIHDACHPAWLGRRLVVARVDPPAVAVSGRPIVGAAALARLLPGRPPPEALTIRSLGAGGGRVVVGLVAQRSRVQPPEAAAVAVLSRSGVVESRRALPGGSLPAAVGLVSGRRFWYFDATRREARSFSVAGQRPLPLRPAAWLAWSPDARYVAAATLRGLVLADRRGEETALVPIRAQEVAWTLTRRRGAERRAG